MIRIESDGTTATIFIDKIVSFDEPCYSKLKSALNNLQNSSFTTIHLDMSKCLYLDTKAITSIVSLYNQLKKTGKNIKMLHVSDEIRELLHSMQIDIIIPVE